MIRLNFSIAIVSLLMITSGCGGNDGGSDSVSSVDLVERVQQIASTKVEDAEPDEATNIRVSGSEETEPLEL